jgi:hypothetical protein
LPDGFKEVDCADDIDVHGVGGSRPTGRDETLGCEVENPIGLRFLDGVSDGDGVPQVAVNQSDFRQQVLDVIKPRPPPVCPENFCAFVQGKFGKV